MAMTIWYVVFESPKPRKNYKEHIKCYFWKKTKNSLCNDFYTSKIIELFLPSVWLHVAGIKYILSTVDLLVPVCATDVSAEE